MDSVHVFQLPPNPVIKSILSLSVCGSAHSSANSIHTGAGVPKQEFIEIETATYVCVCMCTFVRACGLAIQYKQTKLARNRLNGNLYPNVWYVSAVCVSSIYRL